MANTLGNFNPQYFANRALQVLIAKLGVTGLVNRHYEEERAAFNEGDIVNIRRPSTFTAQSHVAGTGTTTQDINGQNVAITIDKHEEVKFSVSDVEIAKAGEKLMTDHIGPAVHALALKIEQQVYLETRKIAPVVDVSGAASAAAHLTAIREAMAENNVPVDSGEIYYAMDFKTEAELLQDQIFAHSNIVGNADGQDALVRAQLRDRFGIKMFVSQAAKTTNVATTGTIGDSGAAGDRAGAVNNGAGYAVNVATMAVDGLTGVETAKDGYDSFTIAGDPTEYMLTADLTLVAGAGSVSFFPALRQPVLDNAVITFRLRTAREDNAAGFRENLAFHRNALGLVVVPMSLQGNGVGAQIAVARDEQTGLAIRLRRYYDGDTATMLTAVDALFGIQTLDPMLGMRTILAP